MQKTINTEPYKLLLELQHDEYPYFQEVERLSRYISFLAFECYVNYQFFHKMTSSPPYAKLGVEVTGYSTRCLFFGLYFKQLRRSIALLMERNIPVNGLKNQREFRDFLQISHDAYQWFLENTHSFAEASMKIDLRPPGPATCALVRLSGPRHRCQELWERHLRAVPSDFDENKRTSRDPIVAMEDSRTLQRRAIPPVIFGREVDTVGVPLDGEPLEDPAESDSDSKAERRVASTGRRSREDDRRWSRRRDHWKSDHDRRDKRDNRGDWHGKHDRHHDARSHHTHTDHDRYNGDDRDDWYKQRNYRHWHNDKWRWQEDSSTTRHHDSAGRHNGSYNDRQGKWARRDDNRPSDLDYRDCNRWSDSPGRQSYSEQKYVNSCPSMPMQPGSWGAASSSEYVGPPARPLQPGALVIGPGVPVKGNIPPMPQPPCLPSIPPMPMPPPLPVGPELPPPVAPVMVNFSEGEPTGRAEGDGRTLLELAKLDHSLMNEPRWKEEFCKNFPSLVPELERVLATASSSGQTTS